MQIFIQSLAGRTIALDVDNHSSVSFVKDKIYEKEGIPSDLQRLMYFGKHVTNEMSLQDLPLQHLNVFQLSLRIVGGVQVIVKSLKGPTITLDVELSATVESLKQKIEESQGISIPEITLALKGKKLDNDAILNTLNVKENTVLLMMRNPKAAKPVPQDPVAPTLCLNNCGFYGYFFPLLLFIFTSFY